MMADGKGIYRRFPVSSIPAFSQESCQITGNTEVGSAFYPVGCYVNLDRPVVFNPEIVSGFHPYRGIIGQNDNSVGIGAQAGFNFGTDHPFGCFSPDFCFFDGQGFIPHVQCGSDSGNNDFLACNHIGGSANYRQQSGASGIYFGFAQVVAVRVGDAFHHFSDDKSLEALL